MNYGPWVVGSLHAPSATIDDSGRYLGIFNMHTGKELHDTDETMTLPRHYWLDSDNSLQMAPVAEIESLRFDHRSVEPMDIPANSDTPLDGIGGKAVEIRAVIDPGAAREVGLYVLRSPDGAERTRISLYPTITADSTPAPSRSTCRSRHSEATYWRGRPRSARSLCRKASLWSCVSSSTAAS